MRDGYIVTWFPKLAPRPLCHALSQPTLSKMAEIRQSVSTRWATKCGNPGSWDRLWLVVWRGVSAFAPADAALALAGELDQVLDFWQRREFRLNSLQRIGNGQTFSK